MTLLATLGSRERTPVPALPRLALVDRARPVLEEPGAPSAFDGDDLGDDGRGDLLRALGAEVEAGGTSDPGAVGVRDVDALVAELGEQALGPHGRPEHRDEARVRGEQRANVVLVPQE